MSAHKVKICKYLGMTLQYTEVGTVKVSMIDYIDEIIAAFDKADPRGIGINTSAVLEDLYNFDEGCENLSLNKVKVFHNIVAKTL